MGMGASYILLLAALYLDNGKNLPLWRELPPIAFWLLPGGSVCRSSFMCSGSIR